MGAEVTRNNSKLNDANKINQPVSLNRCLVYPRSILSSYYFYYCTHLQIQQAEIQAMREAGKMGSEIVEALTNNSATFETKSEFAQEKYKYVLFCFSYTPTFAVGQENPLFFFF